jgi:ribosome-interacting GTPase 1
MNNILEGLNGVVCIMDDVFVFAKTNEEHDKRLNETLSRFERAGITVNKEKRRFAETTVTFIGQIVGHGQVRSDPDKIRAILEMPELSTVADIRQILGLVNQQANTFPSWPRRRNPFVLCY